MNLVKCIFFVEARIRGAMLMSLLLAGTAGSCVNSSTLSLFAGKDLSKLSLEAAAVSGEEIVVDSSANLAQKAGSGPSAGKLYRQAQLTTPVIAPPEVFDQLIVSWNASCPEGTWVVVEARARQAGKWSPWFNLGYWALDTTITRTSISGQKNAFGRVDTDTLVLSKPADAAQVRLQLCFTGKKTPSVKLIACDLSRSSESGDIAASSNAKTPLDVPQISQLSYPPKGSVWCSPTSVTMVMNYWAQRLQRSELATDVRLAAAAIYDEQWGGTGNWTFNTAFAGSRPGLRAFCTRLRGFADVQRWTDRGVPVILSISTKILYDRQTGGDSGHLIVCDGFDDKGDPVVNDPYTKLDEGQSVRRTYPREKLFKAWRSSLGTVYLIYPESMDKETATLLSQ
ncbi:MAG: C39 family peptidase [Armatimonadetes bacterium]|nr:C39 family peptidase [Armatimonadota bacterium]